MGLLKMSKRKLFWKMTKFRKINKFWKMNQCLEFDVLTTYLLDSNILKIWQNFDFSPSDFLISDIIFISLTPSTIKEPKRSQIKKAITLITMSNTQTEVHISIAFRWVATTTIVVVTFGKWIIIIISNCRTAISRFTVFN